MDFFKDAFDGFQPYLDEDAAIKFALNSLLMDRKLFRLVALVNKSSDVGCIEGDPGWELESIDESDRQLSGYSSWPEWASYRAAVDSDCFQLAHPEVYLKELEFKSYVKKALDAYLERNPDSRDELDELNRLIVE